MEKIVIATDYSRSPAGRFYSDGPYSGERFREEFLYPKIAQGEVEVVLDGVLTLGSSFLEEAFGGLVREKQITPMELRKKLKIISRIDTYARIVWGYIDKAQMK
jgi:hypothetical protein